MNTLMYTIAVVIEIGVPVALAFWLTRRFKFGWGVIGVGVLTFIASQVIHIPLLAGIGSAMNALGISFPAGTMGTVLSGLYLGFMAGICEEPMRYFGFKLLKKRAKPFEAGVLAGAGHGGVESIFIGFSVLANFVIISLVSKGGMEIPGITPELIDSVMNTAWYMPLLGALERLSTIILHITLSVLVWRSVSNRKIGWFLLAIGYHMLVDAGAVILVQLGASVILIEAALLVIAGINIWLLTMMKKHWRQSEPTMEINTEQ